jgi:hypothetical protein
MRSNERSVKTFLTFDDLLHSIFEFLNHSLFPDIIKAENYINKNWL